jgi:hypothetical protein
MLFLRRMLLQGEIMNTLATSVSPQEISTQELLKTLEITRNDGLYVDAVIASDANQNVVESLFPLRQNGELYPVLQGTPYASLWEIMPYLRRLEPSDDVETILLEAPTDWGFFAITAATAYTHCQHWRSLCEVMLPSGQKSFFRFQDSRTLYRMIPTFTMQELGWFMGPAARLILPARDQDYKRQWLTFTHPTLHGSSEAKLAQLYVSAKELPWWEVREEHLASMAEAQRAALVYNIAEQLKSELPTIAAMMDRHHGTLRQAVETLVDAGMSHGLEEQKDITVFVETVLLLPLGSENSPSVKNAMTNANNNPASALLRLVDVVKSHMQTDETRAQ